MADPSFFGHYAQKLFDRGWRGILPIRPGAKAPLPKGWPVFTERAQTQEDLENLLRIYGARPGVGLGLCAGNSIVAIDIDCLDPAAAELVSSLTEARLGQTPLIRVGQPPKRMLFYADDLSASSRALRGLPIELYGGRRGATGQVVAFARHPKSLTLYDWPRWTPVEIPPDDLPHFESALFEEVLDEVNVRFPPVQNPASCSHSSRPCVATTDRPHFDPAFQLVPEMLLAQPSSRHATAVRLIARLVSMGLARPLEENLLHELKSAFETVKPEADAEEFLDIVAWARSRFSGDPVATLEHALGLDSLSSFQPPRRASIPAMGGSRG